MRYSSYVWFIGVIYIGIHMCVIYNCGGIYRSWRWGHVQREKRVRCCDWRTYVDPVLPGVIVGVVGDMRHVESVKARVIA